MKKIIVITLLIILSTTISYSAQGSVKDRTNGTSGQIGVHTGEIKNNKNDFVEWKNVNDLDEVKDINNKNTEQDTTISNNTNRVIDVDNRVKDINNKNTEQDTTISNNTNRVIDVDNRVNDLEKSQHKITLGVRVVDTKKFIGEVSATKTVNNNNKSIDFEAKLIYKLGTSYTEKRLNELEKRLRAIEPEVKIVVVGKKTKIILE